MFRVVRPTKYFCFGLSLISTKNAHVTAADSSKSSVLLAICTQNTDYTSTFLHRSKKLIFFLLRHVYFYKPFSCYAMWLSVLHLFCFTLHLPLPNTASLAKTRRILLAHRRCEPQSMDPMQLPDTAARRLIPAPGVAASAATLKLGSFPSRRADPLSVLCR